MEATILVVDDDIEIARAIRLLLEKEKYEVIEAHDGVAALEVLMNTDVHLILLDIMMPKLDGLSALMKIRENQNIPVLILSAKTQDTDKITGLRLRSRRLYHKALSSTGADRSGEESLAALYVVGRRLAQSFGDADTKRWAVSRYGQTHFVGGW